MSTTARSPKLKQTSLLQSGAVIVLGWTLMALLSLAWSMGRERDEAYDYALIEARASFYKDTLYRRWSASHGGVYVPVTEHTPPNPYLKTPSRDVQTTGGLRLTLVNPAYMTRQVYELAAGQNHALQGHITSLNPIRPGNAPDAWERQALESFEKGAAEASAVVRRDGAEHLRFMRPFTTEKSCLKCHEAQGYREGDVRGGISISVPLEPYLTAAHRQLLPLALAHGGLWLAGCLSIGLVFLRLWTTTARRLRAESDLHMSEERYRTVAEFTHDWEFWIGPEGTFRYCSPSCERITGYRREEFLENPDLLLRIIHPDDAPAVVEHMLQDVGAVDDASGELDFRIVRRDGSLRWLSHVCQPVLDAGGAPAGRRGSNRDITQRRAAEEETRVRDRQYQAMLQSSLDGFWAVDGRGCIADVNDAYCRMTGYGRDELEGRPVADFDVRFSADEIRQRIARIMETGSDRFETLHRCKDGRILDIEVSVSFVKEPRPLCISFLRDITGRKRAEAALQESAQKYRLLLENMTTGFALHEMLYDDGGRPVDYRYLEVNPAFERLTGLAAADVVGKTVRQLMPRTEQYWIDLFGSVAVTGEAQAYENYSAELDRHFSVWAFRTAPERFAVIFTDITERRQTMEALRQSEERLRQALEATSDAIWEWDLASDRTYYSPRWFGMLGYETDAFEHTLAAWERLVHPDDLAAARRAITASISQGAGCHAEFRMRHADGSWRWILGRGMITQSDDQGRPSRMSGTNTDITHRKLVEATLFFLAQQGWSGMKQDFLESLTAYLNETLETAYALVVRLTDDGLHGATVAVAAGAAVQPNFQYALKDTPCENVMGQKLCAYEARVQQLFPNDRLLQDMGAESYVGIPLWSSRGEPTGLIAVIDTRPLRSRASIESVLQLVAVRAAAELERKGGEEERARLAAAMDQADEAIVITDRDGAIQYVNPSFEKITGYARQDALGQNPRILKSGRQGPEFYSELWSTIAAGNVWSGRLVNRRKDGSLYDETATITPVRDGAGAIVSFVAVKRDITGELRLEQQLRQSQKMEAIGTLAGGIAHDFNNILGAIYGYTELSMDLAPQESPMRSYLGLVHQSADRARDLVRQILTFSRMTEQERKPVQASLIVKEVCKFLRASLPASITLRFSIENPDDLVMGDPTQVHQILMNLCANAHHAMRDGEGVLEITQQREQIAENIPAAYPGAAAGTYLRLSVKDSGCGISAEHIDKIFDPYFTTKPLGEGTGLGLSVVHGIVKEYGGFIDVESAPDRGTRISVCLPVLEAAEPAPAEDESAQPAAGAGTILFIDDEEFLVDSGQILLEGLGYRVLTATAPQGALSLFEKNSAMFDLVITDKTMPGLSGFDVAAAVRRRRPEMPVILCTGHLDRGEPEKIRAAGFAEVVMKPVTKKKLAEAVSKALAARERKPHGE